MKFIDSRCTQHIKDEGELVVAKNVGKLETLISTIFLFSFTFACKKGGDGGTGPGRGMRREGKREDALIFPREKGFSTQHLCEYTSH